MVQGRVTLGATSSGAGNRSKLLVPNSFRPNWALRRAPESVTLNRPVLNHATLCCAKCYLGTRRLEPGRKVTPHARRKCLGEVVLRIRRLLASPARAVLSTQVGLKGALNGAHRCKPFIKLHLRLSGQIVATPVAAKSSEMCREYRPRPVGKVAGQGR